MVQRVHDVQLESSRWAIVQAVSNASQALLASMVVHVFDVKLESKYKYENFQSSQSFGAVGRLVEIAVCAKFVHLGKCQLKALPVYHVASMRLYFHTRTTSGVLGARRAWAIRLMARV
jgi:hypothetical protein